MYEYRDGKRIRNVGFVKVEQTDESTVVHIHGKGLHLTGDRKLKVYIFYVQGENCIGIWQGDIDHVNPAVNSRLIFTPEDTGKKSVYPLIEGVILENAGMRRFAAVWNDMPVAVEKMQIWKDEPEPDIAGLARQAASENEPGTDSPEAPDCAVPSESGEKQEEPEMSEIEPEQETAVPEEETQQTETAADESAADRSDPGRMRCIKIQRRDIAQLKRCEWRLANNSFLLHGYYSYHHLLLIQEDEKCWLGVPGIYHPREARAAEAFGFPRFMRMDESDVELGEEEKNKDEDFGYWCRPVRR